MITFADRTIKPPKGTAPKAAASKSKSLKARREEQEQTGGDEDEEQEEEPKPKRKRKGKQPPTPEPESAPSKPSKKRRRWGAWFNDYQLPTLLCHDSLILKTKIHANDSTIHNCFFQGSAAKFWDPLPTSLCCEPVVPACTWVWPVQELKRFSIVLPQLWSCLHIEKPS